MGAKRVRVQVVGGEKEWWSQRLKEELEKVETEEGGDGLPVVVIIEGKGGEVLVIAPRFDEVVAKIFEIVLDWRKRAVFIPPWVI
jgi:hypothetical protein